MLPSTLRTLIQHDLDLTNQRIVEQISSEVACVRSITQHITLYRGKQLRAILLLLCAKALNYQGQQHIDLAAIVELLHTATLLHDDVIDHSEQRRYHTTANTLWGDQASVLVGDFIYSRALHLAATLNQNLIVQILSKTVHRMVEGELMQSMHCHNPDTPKEDYLSMIELKTAQFLACIAQIGAIVAEQEPSICQTLYHYGLSIGMSYQLIDDVLDYQAPATQTGKNLGDDLVRGQPTFPIIYALQHATAPEAQILRDALQTGTKTHLPDVLDIIDRTQALHHTRQKATYYQQQALSYLDPIPASPYRDTLIKLAEFIVTRTA